MAQEQLPFDGRTQCSTFNCRVQYGAGVRALHRSGSCGTIRCVRILGVSDQEVEQIYDLVPRGAAGVAMIVGCGDLRYGYLENMVTMLNVDLFYVPGNHDVEYNPGLASARAAGCTNLDLRTACSQGLLLAGLGGSIRYRDGAANQYTQSEAFLRAGLLLPRLWRNRLKHGRALDMLVTHSPPFGIHDEDTHTHRGLKAINWLMEWARPRYVLHGHMHYLQHDHAPDVSWQGQTTVMNVYPYRLIEIELNA